MFTVEPPGDLPSISNKANTILKDMKVNENDVKDLLGAINPNKSVGPDKLHPRMLKELAKCITKPNCDTIQYDSRPRNCSRRLENRAYFPNFQKR